MSVDATDIAAVSQQLGRSPRGIRSVAHRCPCGLPDVIETAPRLPDGTPFPTLYYLTCVKACAAASRLEAAGLMRDMTSRLSADPGLREAYQAAHRDYARRRAAAAVAAGVEPLPDSAQTAGGMPERVKCLHALVAHELAVPGANPVGREAILAMGQWWSAGPCAELAEMTMAEDSKRVAVIDCGTNSLRLLVADISPGAGQLADVHRRMEIVRLGQGVDATGRLAPDALARTFATLAEFAKTISDSGATAVRMVATSATRDASNATEFTAGVRRILGIDPEVVTGAQEAYLSFSGATAELARGGPEAGRPEPPFLVVDIGGGSTEFVLGKLAEGGGEPRLSAISMDIGCVRLTERHLHDDPPTQAQVDSATADIDSALETVALAIPVAGAKTLVGLAGSVTTVTAIALGQSTYDASRTHHARVSAARVHEVTASLLAMKRTERAANPVIHPGRVDVIAAGALILDRTMHRFEFADMVASEHDILDGIAWSMVADGD